MCQEDLIMKKRYTEEQIVRILEEVAAARSATETCRKYGVSASSISRWKAQYASMTVSEVRSMRQMAQENARLRKIVAQQAMDIDAMKDLLSKKW